MSLDTSIAPFPTSKEAFLRTVFGARWGDAFIVHFPGHPDPHLNYRAVYAGGPAASVLHAIPSTDNIYYCVSLQLPGGNHSIQHFTALHVIVVDDVGVKVDRARAITVMGMEPSYELETSPGSFHLGWVLDPPITDPAWAQGLLAKLHAVLGADNLKKISTLVRMPGGINGKNGFVSKLIASRPNNRVTGDDLDALQIRLGTIDPIAVPVRGAVGTMPDPGEIEADVVLALLRGWGMVRDDRIKHMPTMGWGYSIICPWVSEHTQDNRVLEGTDYVPVPRRFECQHGCKDLHRTPDFVAWVDQRLQEESGGTDYLRRHDRPAAADFDEVDPVRFFAEPIIDNGGIDLWTQKTPPEWPGGILPAIEEDDIADQVERDGLDAGALGAVAMTVYSGACDKRTMLAPYASASWQVRPVLWTMLVDETGRRKTATLLARLSRLRRLNLDRMRQYKAAQAHWQSTPKALRQGPPPMVSAVLAEDVTVERLQELMADNPRGLLYLRDELAGLLDFGRYSTGPGAAERAFFLEAYEGGPTTIGRMTRTTVIENTAMALLGGIQQQKLAGYKGLEDDGLLSRLGIILERPTEIGIDKPGITSTRIIDATVDRLLANGAFDDYRTDAAGEAMIRETEALALVLATRPDIGVGFRGFFRKLHGLHARTALLLHLIDGGHDQVIPRDTVSRAWRYARFLYQHAEVFYSGLPGSGDAIAQAIGSFILRHKLTRVTTGQLRRDITACKPMKSDKEIQDAVWLLVIGGWLVPENPWPSNKAWQVRPGIRDQFAERTTQETSRVEQIRLKTGLLANRAD